MRVADMVSRVQLVQQGHCGVRQQSAKCGGTGSRSQEIQTWHCEEQFCAGIALPWLGSRLFVVKA